MTQSISGKYPNLKNGYFLGHSFWLGNSSVNFLQALTKLIIQQNLFLKPLQKPESCLQHLHSRKPKRGGHLRKSLNYREKNYEICYRKDFPKYSKEILQKHART